MRVCESERERFFESVIVSGCGGQRERERDRERERARERASE